VMTTSNLRVGYPIQTGKDLSGACRGLSIARVL
jgi:hypothetical protein